MKLHRHSLFLMSFVLAGCGAAVAPPQKEVKEVYIPDANSVAFDISPTAGSNSSAWIGVYSSQGKTARFRFELDPPKDMDSGVKNLPMAFGKGRFVAINDSDASVFLMDLKKALEAKKLPGKVVRVSQLPIEYVRLGQNQSQAPSDGGFRTDPPGNWSVAKIFLGKDNQECEFFLNFNPIIGKGQFSIKDPDYGDELLAQLAKVL